MKWRESVNNVPKGKGVKIKRGSKNNLTYGAFGQVGSKKIKSATWVKFGIPLKPATSKGLIPAVYVPYKTKSIVIPKGPRKKNRR